MFKKKSDSKVVPVCVSGSEAQKGRRATMEDTHIHLDDVTSMYKFPPDMSRAFYGVYDGHGGIRAAEIAKQYLHECIIRSDELKKKDLTDEQILELVRVGFKRTDSVVLKRSQEGGFWDDGCTAVSVLVWGSKLYIGNVGDAEAVLARKQKDGSYVAELLTFKHKPTDEAERKRIKEAGGSVVFGRVLGTLAVSRAFGDGEFKLPRCRATADFVSSDPFLKAVPIDENCQFMVIACDGLWDKMTYSEAVDLVSVLPKTGKNAVTPEDAAKKLVTTALEKGTLDNVSCIVVYFSW